MNLNNYRTHHDIHLFGKTLTISGMARPDYNGQNVEEALKTLKNLHPTTILIGLFEYQSFEQEACTAGIEYHHIPIVDNRVSPPEIYDAIYNVIKSATNENKHVTIHCSVGDGRTGTALASLKLRDLIEKAVMTNPFIVDEQPEMTALVSMGRGLPCKCTPLVKMAVEHIRTHRTAPDDANGQDSVESPSNIETLINYEKHIRRVIKNELIAQPRPPATTHSTPKKTTVTPQAAPLKTCQNVTLSSLDDSIFNLMKKMNTSKTTPDVSDSKIKPKGSV